VGDLESRLRKLEQKVIELPSADDYLDADNRQRARTMKAIAEELHWLPGFPAHRVFTEWHRQVLLGDTPERRQRDRQTIEAWRKAQGLGPGTQAERAKEKWEAMLEVRGGK
jgi:hypothetical protein